MIRICWHKWSDWSDPVVTYAGNLQQWKICKKCNKAEFRTLKWHKQTQLSVILNSIAKVRGDYEQTQK